MEDVFMWLNQPLFQDSFIRIWMAAAVGTGFVLAMILIIVLIRKRKKKEKAKLDEKDPITEKPDPLPILELANLQGIGNREEQQDAFGISRMEHLEEDGLLAVLCDGMGGMAEGGMIAAETAAEMVGMFPWENDSTVADWIRQRSGRVYQQFRGHGGTTLARSPRRRSGRGRRQGRPARPSAPPGRRPGRAA